MGSETRKIPYKRSSCLSIRLLACITVLSNECLDLQDSLFLSQDTQSILIDNVGKRIWDISYAKNEQKAGYKSTNYTDRLNYPLFYYVSYSSESFDSLIPPDELGLQY